MMTLPCRILITARSFGIAYTPVLDRLASLGCTVVECREGRGMDTARLEALLPTIDVWVSAFHPTPDRMLALAPRLRLIVKHGVGLDHIDLPAAARRGILVATAPGSTEHSVPEHALAMLLALARRLIAADQEVRGGSWGRVVGTGLHGKTLGIVGLGRIGANLADKARGFGMRLLGHDPLTTTVPTGVESCPLETLLASSHAVVLCCPLTDATRQLINERSLARMPRGALLVNCARGELVDDTAVAGALTEGRLGGYAADVFSVEPPTASPLLLAPNTVFSPHAASYSEDSLRLMGERVCDAIAAFRNGTPVPFLAAY